MPHARSDDRTGSGAVARPALLAALLFASLAGAVVVPAAAQIPTPTLTAPAAEKPDPEAIARVVRALEDPERRAELLGQLRALQAAEAAETPPEGLGTQLLGALSDRVEALGGQIATAGAAVLDVPDAVRWLRRQVSDPAQRATWGWFALDLAMALLAGQAARLLTRRLLRRPRATLGAKPPASTLGKLLLLAVRAALDLLPLAAFAAAGYGALSLTAPPAPVRLAGVAFLNASIFVQAALLAVRAVLSPGSPNLRLLRMSDAAAARLFRWARAIALTAVYGLTLAAAARTLGLPDQAAATFVKGIGFAVTLMLVALILGSRRSVAAWLRGEAAAVPLAATADAEAPGATPADAKPGRRGVRTGRVLRAAGRRLAGVWHVVAILYTVVAFAIWALEIRGGFEFLLHATLVSALAAAAARLFARAVTEGARSLRTALVAGPAPWFVARGERYVGPLARFLKLAAGLLAAGVVLDAWGAPVGAWIDSAAGQRLAASAISVLLVTAVALAVWEVASGAVERYLHATDGNGMALERTARARTLLPLLRNAVLVLLVLLVALTALSELGLDIAPFLAGAGVIGLAIGFGAQTLVKDVITGLFILFEDSISVGDVVTVGDKGGLVEGMTIRTIRLRDLDGTVHTIPFSAVTSVSNMTKDFSYYVFDVRISFAEDPDRVVKVLQEVGAGLQADPAFRSLILAPLEVLGVDGFLESALLIKARIKTKPIQQWTVGREFNRRLKKRFTELGIEIPLPQRTLHLAKGGAALADGDFARAFPRVDGRTSTSATTQ